MEEEYFPKLKRVASGEKIKPDGKYSVKDVVPVIASRSSGEAI